MGLDRPLDITVEQHKTVLALLARHLPNTRAWVYGSRVKWTSRPQSDLDLVVFATPEQAGRVSDLREAFEETNLPFRVDLFVWDEVPEQFRKTIEAEHVVLVEIKDLGRPGEWNKHEVKALIEDGALEIGDGYRAKNTEFAGSGVPFARAGNIKNGFQFNDADHFPEASLYRVGDKISNPGDVVFTSKGTVGRFAFVREDTPQFVYSPQLCFWRSRDHGLIDPRFLFFWMFSREFFVQFKGVAGQTDMAEYVSLRDQRNMHLTLPPLPEQQSIAHILGTLDDKFELNRRMNQTLEEMARALFKSWFVDFNPVHAKATLKHESTPPQRGSDWSVERARAYLDRMDPNIAALFPDSFMDSELGLVPEGWRVVPLAEVIAVNPPRPLGRGYIAPYLDMANMPTKGHKPETVIDRPFGSGMRFTNGDTLLARITPCLENGKTAYVDFLKEDQIGWGSTEYIVLRPKAPLPSEFAYCLGRNAGFREFAIQNMTGTSGRQRVPATAISNYRIIVPNGREVPQMFGEIVEPLFSLASQNADESRTLAALRDTLLPKLTSGKLRVKDVERIVEIV